MIHASTSDFSPPDDARGVFSTALVIEGAIIAQEAHLARLEHSAHELYGADLPPQLAQVMAERARGQRLARLRTSLVPQGEGLHTDITVTAIGRDIVLPGWDRGLSLRSVAVDDWAGAHKWNDRRLLSALDERCAPESALLVDHAGAVLETTRASLFVGVGQGAMVTPTLDGRILPGVMRAEVISLARELGIRVDERRVQLTSLAGAAEMFTTGAVRGIEPVRAIDGVPVAGPGRLTTLLADRLRAAWFA